MLVENATSLPLEGMINYEKYPIHARDSEAYKSLIAQLKVDISEKGSISLPDFLTSQGIEVLQQTVIDKTPEANRALRYNNAYDMPIPDDVPEGHALRIVLKSSYASLGHYQLKETFIDQLYTCEHVRNFAANVLEIPQLYVHEDKYNACVVMMYEPGDRIDWHFDYGHFVCLINIHEITEGGFHECAPNLRTEDDNCYEDVAAVLNGDRSRVHQSRSTPGAFTIFKGKYSMHRVSEVTGTDTRKSLVMTYEEKTGQTLTEDVRQRYFYREEKA